MQQSTDNTEYQRQRRAEERDVIQRRVEYIKADPVRWAAEQMQRIDKALGKVHKRKATHHGNVSMYDHLLQLNEEYRTGKRARQDIERLEQVRDRMDANK